MKYNQLINTLESIVEVESLISDIEVSYIQVSPLNKVEIMLYGEEEKNKILERINSTPGYKANFIVDNRENEIQFSFKNVIVRCKY